MKTWKIMAALTLAVLGFALVTASAYAYMGGHIVTPFTTNTGTTIPYGNYGGGMMGGYGYGYEPVHNYGSLVNVYNQTTPTQPNTATATTSVYPYYGGAGCGGMRARIGYASSPVAIYPTNATTSISISITTAAEIAQNYVVSINNPDLVVTHVEEYTNNFYVQVSEKNTGFGAFELLINKYTGTISPEMGPNMVWNTKYSMMNGGMMGHYITTPIATMAVNATQATTIAQQYLNTALSGTTVGDVTGFYGYYTLEVLNAGNPCGMLSVNGYTGQVWYHTWHGTFISELTL